MKIRFRLVKISS